MVWKVFLGVPDAEIITAVFLWQILLLKWGFKGIRVRECDMQLPEEPILVRQKETVGGRKRHATSCLCRMPQV